MIMSIALSYNLFGNYNFAIGCWITGFVVMGAAAIDKRNNIDDEKY